MNKLLLVGKWFSLDILAIFIADFLIKSPCRAPPPTLKPENCDSCLLHTPNANELRRVKNPPQHHLRVACRPVTPASRLDAIQEIAKFQIVSHESVV